MALWCRAAGRPMAVRAKAAFRFARGQLQQLQTLLAFSSLEALLSAAAPHLLAVARGATVAFTTNGMHARGGHVETEAVALASHVDPSVRRPCI
jgi:hypothetical protein